MHKTIGRDSRKLNPNATATDHYHDSDLRNTSGPHAMGAIEDNEDYRQQGSLEDRNQGHFAMN